MASASGRPASRCHVRTNGAILGRPSAPPLPVLKILQRDLILSAGHPPAILTRPLPTGAGSCRICKL